MNELRIYQEAIESLTAKVDSLTMKVKLLQTEIDIDNHLKEEWEKKMDAEMEAERKELKWEVGAKVKIVGTRGHFFKDGQTVTVLYPHLHSCADYKQLWECVGEDGLKQSLSESGGVVIEAAPKDHSYGGTEHAKGFEYKEFGRQCGKSLWTDIERVKVEAYNEGHHQGVSIGYDRGREDAVKEAKDIIEQLKFRPVTVTGTDWQLGYNQGLDALGWRLYGYLRKHR